MIELLVHFIIQLHIREKQDYLRVDRLVNILMSTNKKLFDNLEWTDM